MSIMINDIVTPLECTKEEIVELAIKKLKTSNVKSAILSKSSVDARKGAIKFVSSVAIKLATDYDEKLIVDQLADKNITYKETKPYLIDKGTEKISSRPVIVGFGPAGMFASLILARNGFKPIVIERGADMDSRIKSVTEFWELGKLNTENNVQFGEGGAGTFSDGKLTTRIGDFRCGFVLEELVKHGASEDILVKAKPHIGTDNLRNIVKSIRQEIISLGGEVRFFTKLEKIIVSENRLVGVSTSAGIIDTENVVMAIGHSARDTFDIIEQSGIYMESKSFSVGFRIEHLQSDINKALYGRNSDHPNIPVGEYQLSYREGDRAAYTFCMCPGGTVVAATSEVGGVVTNGMSEYARNLENANSALVVSVSSEDFGNSWRDGVNFQRSLEKKAFNQGYIAPAQTVGNFLGNSNCKIGDTVKPSYALGVKEANLSEIFPEHITSFMKKSFPILSKKLRGFDNPYAVLTGVETRTSSPIRINRGDDLCSISVKGLYPCGEGAGYAGGIISASVDGLRCAESIVSKYSAL